MSRKGTLILTLAAVLILAVGLGVYLATHDREMMPAITYDGLISRLHAAGATTAPGGNIEQPFFSVHGRFLTINGEDVQVFEYAAADAANHEASRVAPDGCAVGTAVHINWIAPPHFYKQGRLIVLYIGDNGDLLQVLSSALGPQFAGATNTRVPPCP